MFKRTIRREVGGMSVVKCSKCKGNKWKTVVKGKKYMCRICHHVREIKEVKREGKGQKQNV